jgi:hypothetical protein
MKNGKWKMKNEIVKPREEPCWYEKKKINPVINLKDEIKLIEPPAGALPAGKRKNESCYNFERRDQI